MVSYHCLFKHRLLTGDRLEFAAAFSSARWLPMFVGPAVAWLLTESRGVHAADFLLWLLGPPERVPP